MVLNSRFNSNEKVPELFAQIQIEVGRYMHISSHKCEKKLMQCAIKEIGAGRSRQLTLSDIKSGTFQQMIQILIIRLVSSYV